MEKRIGRCVVCGSQFETTSLTRKYCGQKCQHIACRTPQNEVDEAKAIKMVARCGSEWEYVGGYTGSEGHMIVRHIPCGTEAIKSSQTVRKGRKLICPCCSAENAEKRKAERKQKKKREPKTEIKPVKFKLEHVQECAVCGSFYFGRSNSKYCGDECKRAVMNRLSAIKRDTKRKLARTSHSNEITVRSLYNRDNGICWICGEKCDINAHWNSNEYPSIDHITPVSLGGKDEWENVRLAHRICNSLRGNKTVEYPHGCEKVLSIA